MREVTILTTVASLGRLTEPDGLLLQYASLVEQLTGSSVVATFVRRLKPDPDPNYLT
jgi:hypothetical protein